MEEAVVTNIDEQYARGKKLRQQVPRSTHAAFKRSPEVDPVKVLTDQDLEDLEEGVMPHVAEGARAEVVPAPEHGVRVVGMVGAVGNGPEPTRVV